MLSNHSIEFLIMHFAELIVNFFDLKSSIQLFSFCNPRTIFDALKQVLDELQRANLFYSRISVGGQLLS